MYFFSKYEDKTDNLNLLQLKKNITPNVNFSCSSFHIVSISERWSSLQRASCMSLPRHCREHRARHCREHRTQHCSKRGHIIVESTVHGIPAGVAPSLQGALCMTLQQALAIIVGSTVHDIAACVSHHCREHCAWHCSKCDCQNYATYRTKTNPSIKQYKIKIWKVDH